MVFDWNRLVLSTTLWPTTGVGRNFKEFIHFRPQYKCTLAFRALSSNLIFRCFDANLLKNYGSGPDASHFRWLPPLCHQLGLHKPNHVRFSFFHLILDLISNIETWLRQQKNQIQIHQLSQHIMRGTLVCWMLSLGAIIGMKDFPKHVRL